MLTQHRNSGGEFFLAHSLRAGENDGGGVLDLVVIELAEVFHIHLDFGRVGYGRKAVEDSARSIGRLNGADNVGKLADAGRLDQDAVGVVLFDNLMQRLCEVADQTATDAAGVHLIDLDTGFFQKAAVDADLAELVFDQNQLFAFISVSDQLFNKGGLACSEKSGEDIYFGHGVCFLS